MPDMFDYIRGENTSNHESELKHCLTFLQTPSDMCVPMICSQQGLKLPPHIHVSACAASTDAIGTAFWDLRCGRSDWMIAGGTDSMVNPLGVGGFCKLQALTRRNNEPGKASRPFDRSRDGFLIGEGAAFLILETVDHARSRGAKYYAEVVGYGNSFDAHGISEPHPQGEGALVAMGKALADAEIDTHDIIYINAHGTSTPKNDVIETQAIKRLFGQHAYDLAISSTKSMIGHLISASGAAEVAAMLGCAQQGYVHPTINLEYPDPQCDLDYVADGKRAIGSGYLLKNSFGFGGQNAALVFRI
jgi:3-oxoacyl-[acyl-carrier-protein] synthase II